MEDHFRCFYIVIDFRYLVFIDFYYFIQLLHFNSSITAPPLVHNVIIIFKKSCYLLLFNPTLAVMAIAVGVITVMHDKFGLLLLFAQNIYFIVYSVKNLKQP